MDAYGKTNKNVKQTENVKCRSANTFWNAEKMNAKKTKKWTVKRWVKNHWYIDEMVILQRRKGQSRQNCSFPHVYFRILFMAVCMPFNSLLWMINSNVIHCVKWFSVGFYFVSIPHVRKYFIYYRCPRFFCSK